MDSIQLKIAKIQAGAYNINDICDVMKDILQSNVLVISKKGKILKNS